MTANNDIIEVATAVIVAAEAVTVAVTEPWMYDFCSFNQSFSWVVCWQTSWLTVIIIKYKTKRKVKKKEK